MTTKEDAWNEEMPAWMFPGMIQQKTTTPWGNLAAFFDRNPEEHHLKQLKHLKQHHLKQHHLKPLKHHLKQLKQKLKLKQKQKQQKQKHHSLKHHQRKNALQAKNPKHEMHHPP